PESLAILDLEGRGISTVEATSLTDRLRNALVRTGGVTIVERGQMEQVLSEQDFQLTGCTSDECAVEVGQLLGVTTMVAGSIGKVGATYSVDIRTIDVQSGRITHSLWRDYRGEIDGLLGLMPDIAGELVAAIGTAPAPEPVIPPPTILTVNTSPLGALVTMNGAEAGTTPLDSIEVAAGQWHTLSLSFDGYRTMDTTILAESGQSHDLFFTLTPLPSRLTILSDPPGAQVVVDGEDRGTTPLTEFALAGNRTYTASLRMTGYQPVDTSFYAAADEVSELRFTLKKLPGRLTILSDPPGAAVFLDSRQLGQTPANLDRVVPDRRHTVALRLDGYAPLDTTFLAVAGELHRLELTMQPVAVAATTVTVPEMPPSETQPAQPVVKPEKKGGGTWLLVAALAATGYYGYTQGWFGERPSGEELRVGPPPPVPSP
ncbi:MAG: PEGA domain-containing protein, partial [Fidelibacterota bacterium]